MGFFRILVLFSLSLSMVMPAHAKAKDKLKFTLYLVEEKEEYAKDDPISVNLNIKNRGKKPVFVNKRFYINSNKSDKREREVYFIATSPKGEKLEYRQDPYDTGLPRADDIRFLKPGDEVEGKYKRNLRAYFEFPESGEYEIKAVYENVFGEELGLDVFKKKLTSNTIKVNVVN